MCTPCFVLPMKFLLQNTYSDLHRIVLLLFLAILKPFCIINSSQTQMETLDISNTSVQSSAAVNKSV